MQMADFVAEQIEIILSDHTGEWEKREAVEIFTDMIKTHDHSINLERLTIVADVIQQQLDEGGNYVKWVGRRNDFEEAISNAGWLPAVKEQANVSAPIDTKAVGIRRASVTGLISNP